MTRQKGVKRMFQPTKIRCLLSLREALYHLEGAVNKSQDLLHCIDELHDVIEHLEAVEAEEV